MRSRFSVPVFGVVVGGCLLILSVASAVILRHASQSVDEHLAAAARNAYGILDAQIGLLLHYRADVVIRRLGHDMSSTFRDLKSIANSIDVDEVYVLGRSGEIIASSLPEATTALTGVDLRADPSFAPYFELFINRKCYYGQQFRPSFAVPGSLMKYIGIHLPRQGVVLLLGYSFNRFDRDLERRFCPIFNEIDIWKDAFYVLADRVSGRIVVAQAGHEETEGSMLDDLCSSGCCPKWLPSLAPFFGQRYRFHSIYERTPRAIPGYVVQSVGEAYWRPVRDLGFLSLSLLVFCVIYRVAELRVRRERAKVEYLRQRELATAHTIQMSEMRLPPVNSPHYAVSALVEPAHEVGGDFFDYYQLPDGRFVVTVADVSDKGIPAAIFMMKSRLILRAQVASSASLAAAVTDANDRLHSNNAGKMFVTAFVGVFDPQTGRLTYVSAGHNPPILRHADGSVEWVRGRRSLVLGLRASVVYHEEVLPLSAGDRLLLYTDGVTEAMGAHGDFYGEARLEAAVRIGGRNLAESIKADVAAFVGGTEQSDDITLMEFQVADTTATCRQA